MKETGMAEGMKKCKALLYSKCFLKCKTKKIKTFKIWSEVVHLVLEYTQECNYVWF